MPNPQDERAGCPSGSSALQDQLCPGRFQLQKQWDTTCPSEEPEVVLSGLEYNADPENIDNDAEAGKRIHLLYAGKACTAASQAEIDRAEKALQVDAKMKSQWLTSLGADLEPEIKILELRETRWWLRDEKGDPIYSGQSDVVWIRGNEDGPADILLGDLKGLWGHHDPAPLNMQIRRYIALIAANAIDAGYTGINSASAYLNQPAKTLMPAMTVYDEEAIQMAVLEMHSDIAAMMDPKATRTAGPVQCHHCTAKLICPEYQEAQLTLVETVSLPAILEPPTKEALSEAVKLLPASQLSKLLDWTPALENACELAKFEAKRRLREDALSLPGWNLKPNPSRSKVEDVNELFKRCALAYGVTAEVFTKLCSIPKGAVIELVKAHSGLKGAALDAKVVELLAGTTRAVKVQHSLERLK